MDEATIAFTGGGTGGHIYPGLAVAEALRSRGFSGRIAWIGSKKDSDRETVEAAGIEFFAVPSGKLRRELSMKNVADAFRVVAGYAWARRALKSLRPALLFSKGGYASVAPCAAAASLGIPYFTHESDITPGLATRLNARRAETIVLSYEATRGLLPASARTRALVSGNPVRAAIRKGDAVRGRYLLGIGGSLPVVFFLGGSQGARQINELALAALPRLTRSAFVVHQRGRGAGRGKRRDILRRLPLQELRLHPGRDAGSAGGGGPGRRPRRSGHSLGKLGSRSGDAAGAPLRFRDQGRPWTTRPTSSLPRGGRARRG